MSDSTAKDEKSQNSGGKSAVQMRIREIQKRDLMVVRHLVSDYPGFKNLGPEDQLDRIVLVLESICGYGAISVDTIQQLESVFTTQVKELSQYFKTSQYKNSETGEMTNKFRESFEDGFCLEREFKKALSQEGEESEINEPIRKKVPAKPKAPEPEYREISRRFSEPNVTKKPVVKSSPVTSAPSPSSSQNSPVEEVAPSPEVKVEAPTSVAPSPKFSGQNLDKNAGLSTGDVDKESEEMKKSPLPLIVGGAVLVIVVIVILAFVLSR